MKFVCQVRQSGGSWVAEHSGKDIGPVRVTAPTREEALRKLETEIRYWLEMCPCTGNAFRKALLVEYPYPGCWTIAFQTGSPAIAVAGFLDEEHISVYVPTTPNPTSGFFLMLPRSRVHDLEMTVDEALKYIISMGVVAPKPRAPPVGHELPAAASVLNHRN